MRPLLVLNLWRVVEIIQEGVEELESRPFLRGGVPALLGDVIELIWALGRLGHPITTGYLIKNLSVNHSCMCKTTIMDIILLFNWTIFWCNYLFIGTNKSRKDSHPLKPQSHWRIRQLTTGYDRLRLEIIRNRRKVPRQVPGGCGLSWVFARPNLVLGRFSIMFKNLAATKLVVAGSSWS